MEKVNGFYRFVTTSFSWGVFRLKGVFIMFYKSNKDFIKINLNLEVFTNTRDKVGEFLQIRQQGGRSRKEIVKIRFGLSCLLVSIRFYRIKLT